MTDLSTLEGQKAHYRAIRAKFMPAPTSIMRSAISARSAPVPCPPPIVAPDPRAPRQKVAPKQKPTKPTRRRRDWLRLSSKGFVPEVPREVLARIAMVRHVSISSMLEDVRHMPVVIARWEAMWMMETHLHMNTKQIAEVFKKDPTTIIHGINRHQERLDARGAR